VKRLLYRDFDRRGTIRLLITSGNEQAPQIDPPEFS
jgi:hypothetical protein